MFFNLPVTNFNTNELKCFVFVPIMGRIKINLKTILKRLNIESEYSKYIRPFNLDLILINLSFF